MKLVFDIKCSSCGSGDIILDKSPTGIDIAVCNNPNCADYQCFWELELYVEDAEVLT